MLRFSLVLLVLLLIPVFGPVHQDARALQAEKLTIKVGAEEKFYEGALHVSVAQHGSEPLTGLVILPFRIATGEGAITCAPPDKVDARAEVIFGADDMTGLHIQVHDRSLQEAIIQFRIIPKLRASDTPPDSALPASLLKNDATEFLLERQDIGSGPRGGAQRILF